MSATAFQRKRREQAAKEDIESKQDLSEYTVKELKAMLEEKGIEHDTRAKKEELIKLLEDAE